MQDSKEKVLRDWNEPIKIHSVKRLVGSPIFKTFDELYRYLKLFAKKQGDPTRFNMHPYDNFHHYANNKIKYNKTQQRMWEEANALDKIEEKAQVSRRIEFWKRIKGL